MKKVITRFAPSPTGTLHIGGVRTALFNYVYPKQNDALFLIRIEDTDRERSTKEYEKDILDNLSSIGLSPDQKPINQSERNEIYTKAAEKIIESGNAYWCDCTPEELDKMRNEQTAAGIKPMYDGRSRNLGLERSEKTVLRLATPEDGDIIVNDIIRGEIKFNNNELDDLILLRSDGTPTYHLCNVVDDYEQNVTTVIRGEDHISNTPRQIHIQNALGYPELEYAHLPLVLGTDKKRLSKRNAATSLEEYREKGYLDSALQLISNKKNSLFETLLSGFPAGTVSGAPKIRAMEIIDELEKNSRKIYAGGIGYFSANGDFDTCIALRTAITKNNKFYVQAGAGLSLIHI